MEDAQINIEFKNNIFVQINQLNQQFVSLKEQVEKLEGSSKSSFKAMNESIKGISLNALTDNLQRVTSAFSSINKPGLEFNKSILELKALTGVTGKGLDKISSSARQLSKDFGGSAAKSVDSYKMILSQLGPELAQTPVALQQMGEAVAITSKLMGGDQLAATEVLTAAMNQYGVSLEDPIAASETMKDMMNVMAKAAAEGSSELPNIKLAIENAGMASKAAGVSFEEMNAAIQVLDKAGKRGAEGGIALRNVMNIIAKGRFLPKDVQEELEGAGISIADLTNKNKSLSDRLNLLKPLLGDSALLTKTFGMANANAAMALIAQTEEVDRYTEAITGTKNAEEQVAVIMESREESLARMQARIDDVKVSLFEATGSATAFIAPFSEIAMQFNSFYAAGVGVVDIGKGVIGTAGKIATSLKSSAVATNIATTATRLFTTAWAISPIGVVTMGILGAAMAANALSKALSKGSIAQQAANNIHKKAVDIAAEEITTISILSDRIRKSKKDRKDAIQELIAKYPDLLNKYKDEAGILENINSIQQELADNAMERAKKQAAAELYKEQMREIVKMENTDPSTWQKMKGLFTTKEGFFEGYSEGGEAVHRKKLEEAKKMAEKLYESMDKNLPTSTPASDEIIKGDVLDENNLPIFDVKPSGGEKSASEKIEKRNITVKIDKLVENITISTTNLKDSTSDIKRQISEALIGAVRDFEVAM